MTKSQIGQKVRLRSQALLVADGLEKLIKEMEHFGIDFTELQLNEFIKYQRDTGTIVLEVRYADKAVHIEGKLEKDKTGEYK